MAASSNLHDGKRGRASDLETPLPRRLGAYIGVRSGSASREEHLLMLDDIYNKRVLELAADIPRLGRLPRRTRAPRRIRGSAARP